MFFAGFDKLCHSSNEFHFPTLREQMKTIKESIGKSKQNSKTATAQQDDNSSDDTHQQT